MNRGNHVVTWTVGLVSMDVDISTDLSRRDGALSIAWSGLADVGPSRDA
jgi:hypothetical protein